MKNIYKIFFYGFFPVLLLGFASCEDYLDKEPATDIDPEAAYKTFFNFQGFVEEMYSCIPNQEKRDNNNMWNFGEEDHYSSNGAGWALDEMDRGSYWRFLDHWNKTWLYGTDFKSDATESGVRKKKYLWQGSWYGIRKANMGLENLDKLVATSEEKQLIEGQLYFFRAWFHFELTSLWGGLPYIDKVLPADAKLTLPRLSYVECAEKIAADFKKAAELLPNHWDDTQAGKNTIGNNELRINKIMALGYLGKTYLYAGSPWMNVGADGYGTYNTEYCKKAAEAFGELLKLVESGQTKYGLADWSQYTDIYMTNAQGGRMPGLNEAIFRSPNYGTASWDYGSNALVQQWAPAQILQARSWSFYPTANYANYFGMKNGLPINENSVDGFYNSGVAGTESGYDPEHPWKDRDPRFYITYGFDSQRMILSEPSNYKDYIYANLYTYKGPNDNGSYRNPQTGSTTGYILIKFAPVGFNRFDNKNNNESITISWMRLADVYLMYAEAVANGYGSPSSASETYSQLSALDAVDKIRDRAGVGRFAVKYRGDTQSFMKELRRERAVELAYEGHRFNDLRRWRLLDKYPYTLKTRIQFDRADYTTFDKVNPANNRILNLKDEVILERKYGEKHYWFPFIKSDTFLYPEFPQNPGWE